MASCVFCAEENVDAREIYRDAYVRVFPTNIPITPRHLLVVPLRHAKNITELSQEERDALFNAVARFADILLRNFDVEGFNFAWNQGETAFQSVQHLHLHIVPRKTGDTGVLGHDPRSFLYRPGSREETPQAELEAVAAELRRTLAGI